MDINTLLDWEIKLETLLKDLQNLDSQIDDGGIKPELVKLESFVSDALSAVEHALCEVRLQVTHSIFNK